MAGLVPMMIYLGMIVALGSRKSLGMCRIQSWRLVWGCERELLGRERRLLVEPWGELRVQIFGCFSLGPVAEVEVVRSIVHRRIQEPVATKMNFY